MPDGPQAEGGADENAGGTNAMGWSVMRMLALWWFMSAFLKKPLVPTAEPPQGAAGAPAAAGRAPRIALTNAWASDEPIQLRVYVSESPEFGAFDEAALVYHADGLSYSRDAHAGASNEREANVTIVPSVRLQRNQTQLWAHIYVFRAGTSPDAASDAHAPLCSAEAHHPLVKLLRRKKKAATKNLLDGGGGNSPSASGAAGGAAGGAADADAADEYVPHWKPTLAISVVEDATTYTSDAIPPQVGPSLTFDAERGRYVPVIFVNEFWTMAESYVPINETVAELTLGVSFSVTTLVRWMLTAQMQTSLEMQAGVHGEDTMNEMRGMFIETSPWLLGVTFAVSTLHTVFDFLAFKNDVQFWKNNKSMVGISFRSMLINTFFQAIIFLYLCDNDTSWMILLSSGVGLAIEVWKLGKAVKSVSLARPAGCVLPRLRIVPSDSYSNSATKEHDEEAMRYLGLLMYPLVVGYSAYSLVYDEHKSWWSWLIGSAVGCVYTFGFILMTPQARAPSRAPAA